MTVLDAYALIAFLAGGPAAARVRAILREGDGAVATANLAEGLDVCQHVYGVSVAKAMEVIDPMLGGALSLTLWIFRWRAELPKFGRRIITAPRARSRFRRRPDRIGQARRPYRHSRP